MNRPYTQAGWLATGALAVGMLAHAAGLISQAALDHVCLLSIGWATLRLADRHGVAPLAAAAAAVALAGGLALVRHCAPDLRYTPYLLIAPANFFVSWLFASGLLPGREPILLRLILTTGGAPVDDPRFRRFIARQCLLWAGLSFSTACTALGALFVGASQPWLAQLLAWLVAVQALWFVLSHHYASIRYGRTENWWSTARAIVRPETWSRLRAS